MPENLRELYDYIRTGKVEGDLSQRIDEAVCIARKNEEWRSEYMKELLHDDDVREEGRAEGESQLVKLINSMIAVSTVMMKLMTAFQFSFFMVINVLKCF